MLHASKIQLYNITAYLQYLLCDSLNTNVPQPNIPDTDCLKPTTAVFQFYVDATVLLQPAIAPPSQLAAFPGTNTKEPQTSDLDPTPVST